MVGLLLLRVGAGGFMLPHGLGKLFGWFGGPGLYGFAAELQHFGIPSAEPLPLLLALAQAVLGLLVALGCLRRLSAAFAAAFIATTGLLNLPNGWFWMSGGIEYPLLWTMVLVAISLLGPGRFSIEAQFRGVRTPLWHLETGRHHQCEKCAVASACAFEWAIGEEA